MNTFFYMAIDRTDLGKSVAIEFIGPIVVAAVMTHTRRNAAALVLAVAGVAVLGGVELDGNAVGMAWLLAASACWAAYIVIGSRVAQAEPRRRRRSASAWPIGAVVLIPFGAPGSGDVWTSPRLLVACLLVGVFSNAIAYSIDQHVLRRIPVRRFSVLLALLPVTAVAIGWLALDQVPSGARRRGHRARARRGVAAGARGAGRRARALPSRPEPQPHRDSCGSATTYARAHVRTDAPRLGADEEGMGRRALASRAGQAAADRRGAGAGWR